MDTSSITLAGVGGAVVSEGIKFLYGQAAEILKRWRERADCDSETSADSHSEIRLPTVFAEKYLKGIPDYVVVARHADVLREVCKELSEYATDIAEVADGNDHPRKLLNVLRSILEEVYGQTITFKHEDRALHCPPVTVGGYVIARRIGGRVVATSVTEAVAGEIHGKVEADNIAKGADVTAVNIHSVGNPPKSKS